ncbi:MAG TPA: hypothetical protein VKE94_23680 [Gemmataceae bacterium]|nr:hypothetical protein [Gemmataceae bacterium]
MDDTSEIKELLREIRDLQKAHFERYKEFTQGILDRERASAEDVQRFRTEHRQFREEVRATLIPRWLPLAILGVVLGIGLGTTIVTAFLSRLAGP